VLRETLGIGAIPISCGSEIDFHYSARGPAGQRTIV
jgi:hypothetical protein